MILFGSKYTIWAFFCNFALANATREGKNIDETALFCHIYASKLSGYSR